MPLPFRKNNLDPDAVAFCNRSGAQDRIAINAFVRGVKALGLWNSMVCWPLRSTQNAGTGTTAYSLGGLGTFDGTLTDGPTWGANGVNFNAATARITAANGVTFAQPLTVVGAVDFKSLTNGGGLVDSINFGSRVTLWNGAESAQVAMAAGSFFLGGPTFAVGPNFIGGFFNGASSVKHVNGSTQTGNAGSQGLDGIILGNNFIPNFGDKNLDIAFAAIFNGQADFSALRTLYKQTLGTGLGLP